jgi:hypothetical protein
LWPGAADCRSMTCRIEATNATHEASVGSTFSVCGPQYLYKTHTAASSVQHPAGSNRRSPNVPFGNYLILSSITNPMDRFPSTQLFYKTCHSRISPRYCLAIMLTVMSVAITTSYSDRRFRMVGISTLTDATQSTEHGGGLERHHPHFPWEFFR